MGIQDVIRDHPAVGGLVGGVAIGVGASSIINVITKKRKSSAKKSKTTKKRKTTTTRKTKKKTTRSATKRRTRTSKNKIYTTKNGQPYIKLANGKARFISKKSARIRKKRKGGYY